MSQRPTPGARPSAASEVAPNGGICLACQSVPFIAQGMPVPVGSAWRNVRLKQPVRPVAFRAGTVVAAARTCVPGSLGPLNRSLPVAAPGWPDVLARLSPVGANLQRQMHGEGSCITLCDMVDQSSREASILAEPIGIKLPPCLNRLATHFACTASAPYR